MELDAALRREASQGAPAETKKPRREPGLFVGRLFEITLRRWLCAFSSGVPSKSIHLL